MAWAFDLSFARGRPRAKGVDKDFVHAFFV